MRAPLAVSSRYLEYALSSWWHCLAVCGSGTVVLCAVVGLFPLSTLIVDCEQSSSLSLSLSLASKSLTDCECDSLSSTGRPTTTRPDAFLHHTTRQDDSSQSADVEPTPGPWPITPTTTSSSSCSLQLSVRIPLSYLPSHPFRPSINARSGYRLLVATSAQG